MTEPAEPRKPKAKKPAPKPEATLPERDLDKVSGGVTAKIPTPSGPVPIPYPNEA